MSGFWTHPALLVGLGGALGSNARYWLGRWVRSQEWSGDVLGPTLLINLSGSLVLGLVAALARDRGGPAFLLFGTGFCGGYTTFSTFSLEVAELLQRGRPELALGYVATSVVGGFLCFWLAWSLARG